MCHWASGTASGVRKPSHTSPSVCCSFETSWMLNNLDRPVYISTATQNLTAFCLLNLCLRKHGYIPLTFFGSAWQFFSVGCIYSLRKELQRLAKKTRRKIYVFHLEKLQTPHHFESFWNSLGVQRLSFSHFPCPELFPCQLGTFAVGHLSVWKFPWGHESVLYHKRTSSNSKQLWNSTLQLYHVHSCFRSPFSIQIEVNVLRIHVLLFFTGVFPWQHDFIFPSCIMYDPFFLVTLSLVPHQEGMKGFPSPAKSLILQWNWADPDYKI